MIPEELQKPTVPIGYVLMTLQLAAEHGVGREAMLKDVKFPLALLEQPDARLGLLEYGHLCVRALQLTREPALGYEFGLRNTLTAHGLVGFGLMCQPNIRAAIEFASRFFTPLRVPGWDTRFFIEDDMAVVEAFETVPYGLLRQYAIDMLLVSFATTLRPLLPPDAGLELRFACAEPPYYSRYREQIPPAQFSKGANQIRFPASHLTRPLPSANAITARLVARECERELALIGHTEDLLERVRAVLLNEHGQYPSLDDVATRLFMSSRTLKRRLQQHGLSYQHLLDEARKRDCMRLLEDPSLTLEEIASRLGYTTATNFGRAFRKWTGRSPGAFRK